MFQRVSSLRERPEKTKDDTELPSPTGIDGRNDRRKLEDDDLKNAVYCYLFRQSSPRKLLNRSLARKVDVKCTVLLPVEITVDRDRDRRTVITRCTSLEARTTRPIQNSSDWDVTSEHCPSEACHSMRSRIALESIKLREKKTTFATICQDYRIWIVPRRLFISRGRTC